MRQCPEGDARRIHGNVLDGEFAIGQFRVNLFRQRGPIKVAIGSILFEPLRDLVADGALRRENVIMNARSVAFGNRGGAEAQKFDVAVALERPHRRGGINAPMLCVCGPFAKHRHRKFGLVENLTHLIGRGRVKRIACLGSLQA